MEYKVTLSDELELFLDWYLREHPLRPEHKREDYPNVVVNNFVSGMMRRMLQDGRYCKRCEERSKQAQEANIELGG